MSSTINREVTSVKPNNKALYACLGVALAVVIGAIPWHWGIWSLALINLVSCVFRKYFPEESSKYNVTAFTINLSSITFNSDLFQIDSVNLDSIDKITIRPLNDDLYDVGFQNKHTSSLRGVALYLKEVDELVSVLQTAYPDLAIKRYAD